MKIVRLYTGKDGESHFEDIDVPIDKIQPAEGIVFRQAPPGHVQDWHPAPRRQFVITLSGQAEIELSDGTKQRFGPGGIVLAEDTSGQGHITRVIGSEPRLYVSVPKR
jgi:quercetin dioxygenase-like cupin family protein